jgi:hypothetical protein
VARKVVVTTSDTVWVLDILRKHVFTPDMRYVRAEDRSIPADGDLVAFTNGAFVVASQLATPDRAGFPLNLANRAGSVTRSFGVSQPVLDPRRLFATNDSPDANQRRRLTRGFGDTFWAYSTNRFLLEQYDLTGRLLAQGRHSLDGWYEDASQRVPGRGEFPGWSGVLRGCRTHAAAAWTLSHSGNPRITSSWDRHTTISAEMRRDNYHRHGTDNFGATSIR